jgi:hypothetical protein
MRVAGADTWRFKASMVIESIRALSRSVPFRPYEIQTVSGARYQVPHPDFIAISARGSYVVVIDEDERPHHLSSLLIERVSPISPRRKHKSARKS